MNSTATAPAAATVSGAATEKPRFVDVSPKIVPLEDPIAYKAQTFDEIHVIRLSVGQYRAHVHAGGKADNLQLPMYKDAAGNLVPSEIMEALSMRDANSVLEVASSFLNGRPRAADPVPPSTSGSGAR